MKSKYFWPLILLFLPLMLPAQSKFNKFKAQKLVLEGAKKLYNKMYNASLNDFQVAANLDPNNNDVYQFRAEAYYYLKNYDQSLRDFDVAISQHPNDSELYFKRGLTNEKLNLLTEAMYDFQDALTLKPGYSDAARALTQLRRRLGIRDGAPFIDNNGDEYDQIGNQDRYPDNSSWNTTPDRGSASQIIYEGDRLEVNGTPNDYVRIKSVELTKKSTIVRLEITNNKRSTLEFVLPKPFSAEAYYLTDRLFKDNFRLIDILDAEPGRVKINAGSKKIFSLEFDRIPDNMRHLHFRSGKNPSEGALNFYDVVLRGDY